MQKSAEVPSKKYELYRSKIKLKAQSSFYRNGKIGHIARLLLLAATVCAVWLTIENRWGANFALPTRYDYDAHYVLGMMKLAQEGDLGLFTHIYTDSLGAPFTGQLNDFPQVERAIIWLGGQVARATGLMPASNIMLILSCVISALSFYSASRLWKIARFPSWIFSVTYAFLPHNLRSIEHIGIIFTGLLPLHLYISWYISTTQKILWKSHRFRLALIIGLFSGALNIYWIFIFLQIYTFALLFRLVKRRPDFTKALMPLLLTCLTAGSLLGSFIIYKINHGKNSMAVIRSYSHIEQWSLKPIDLFLPLPSNTFPILAKLLSRYYDGGMIKIGENFGSYIGVCASLGLIFLITRGVLRQISKKSVSLPCLTVIWIIAYSSFGGLHSIFSLISNSYEIRGLNRYSTAIASISLLYFVFVIHRLTRRWTPSLRFFCLFGIAIFGLIEQSWGSYRKLLPSSSALLYQVTDYVRADKALVSRLEQNLGTGSMIYMLPVTDFPEPFWGRGSYKGTFYHYQAMRPFLYSTKLRYSYGSNKGRQGADWQLDTEKLPAGEMATTLESYGFSGILLNRRGYADRGEALLAELTKAGWPVQFEQGVDNEWVFIRLTPTETPILPTPTPYALTTKS